MVHYSKFISHFLFHIFFPVSDKCFTTDGPDPNSPCIFPAVVRTCIETDSTDCGGGSSAYWQTFSTCINDGNGKPWCATKVDLMGFYYPEEMPDNWGYCGSECPLPSSEDPISGAMTYLPSGKITK